MTAEELVHDALSRQLIRSSGRTPVATMNARLYGLIHEDPNAPIVRMFEQGATRARRGSVRWALRPKQGSARNDAQPLHKAAP